MTIELDAHYSGCKMRPLDPCEDCAAKDAEIERLRERIASAQVAIMDTRDVLGICAPTEASFPELYALQGKRVRLVLDEVPNDKGNRLRGSLRNPS